MIRASRLGAHTSASLGEGTLRLAGTECHFPHSVENVGGGIGKPASARHASVGARKLASRIHEA